MEIMDFEFDETPGKLKGEYTDVYQGLESKILYTH